MAYYYCSKLLTCIKAKKKMLSLSLILLTLFHPKGLKSSLSSPPGVHRVCCILKSLKNWSNLSARSPAFRNSQTSADCLLHSLSSSWIKIIPEQSSQAPNTVHRLWWNSYCLTISWYKASDTESQTLIQLMTTERNNSWCKCIIQWYKPIYFVIKFLCFCTNTLN